MSADLWLFPDCECPHAHDELFALNVTYNLSPILRDAGWVWSKEALEGVKAADIGEAVGATLTALEASPEKYRAMNPPNGWGNYDGLVEQWRDFLVAVENHPASKVHVWL